MFAGHFAVALASKRLSPRTSLGTLFAAAQLLDLLWPVLLFTGIEAAEVDHSAGAVIPLKFTHYPWSHSLVTVLAWAVLAGLVVKWRTRSSRAAWVIAGLVASHWFLDLIVHVPDLPLAFGSAPRLGLGLWQWPLAALALELLLLLAGTLVYLRAKPGGRSGNWRFYSLIGLLAAIQVANILGPPPPAIIAVAWSGMAMWLLVAWGWWADRQ